MIGPASQAQRVYRRLLRLYPVEFRDRYADEMAQLFTDQIRDARSGHSGRGVARTWLATLADLAATSVAEH